jgi:hypothetical protein
MNGTRARSLRRLAYGPNYRKEHLAFAASQKYAFQVQRGVRSGGYVLVGMRAAYQALKKAYKEGQSL